MCCTLLFPRMPKRTAIALEARGIVAFLCQTVYSRVTFSLWSTRMTVPFFRGNIKFSQSQHSLNRKIVGKNFKNKSVSSFGKRWISVWYFFPDLLENHHSEFSVLTSKHHHVLILLCHFFHWVMQDDVLPFLKTMSFLLLSSLSVFREEKLNILLAVLFITYYFFESPLWVIILDWATVPF